MVDVFEELVNGRIEPLQPNAWVKMKSWWWANRRRIMKRFRGYLADMSHNRNVFLKHRYPSVSLEELQVKISQFQLTLGDHPVLKVEKIHHQFYRISAE